jgi:hypothetical protein
VLLLVLVSRLLFLPDGFGTDPDAWRVAATARRLADTGEYAASRFPGYPLHELLSTPLITAGGALLSNCATAAAMLGLLATWHRAVARRTRHPLLLLLALAFAPLAWKNSVVTMDYIWSLWCLLGGWHAALRGRAGMAGVLLGLAVGFRPPNVVGLAPLLAALLLVHPHPRSVLRFFGAAAVAGGVPLLLPLLAYGPAAWIGGTGELAGGFAFDAGERVLLAGYRAVYAVGPLAALTAAGALLAGTTALRTQLRARDPLLVSSVVGCLTFGILFLAWPLEREYLLPALPFLFLLVDHAAGPRMMTVFLAALLSFAVVNPDVIRHGGYRGTPGFNIRPGLLPEELRLRRLQAARRTELAALELPGPAVIMTGSGPEFWIGNPAFEPDPDSLWRFSDEVIVRQVRNPELHFIDALPREEVGRLRSRGYTVYCHAAAAPYLETILGYPMSSLDIPLVGRSAPVP